MIRYKVLSVAAPFLLNFAKKQAARLIASGQDTFTRMWPIKRHEVRVHCNIVNDDHVVRISITRAALGPSNIFIQLGQLTPLFGVDPDTLHPVFSDTAVVPTRDQIYTALINGEKVVYTSAYMALTGGYFISFDSIDSNYSYTSFTDPQVGAINYKTGVGSLREIDYENNLAWYEDRNALTTKRFLSWAAIDLDSVNIDDTFVFDVNRVFNAPANAFVIPDGIQTANIPMADERFTMVSNVTFTGQVVTGFTTPPASGNWSMTITSITVTQNNAEGAKATVRYRQKYLGQDAHIVRARKEFPFKTNILSSGAGSVSYEYLDKMIVSSVIVGEVVPVAIYTETVTTIVSVTESYQDMKAFVVYSDTSVEEVSVDDPTDIYSAVDDLFDPFDGPAIIQDPLSAYFARWYGPNGGEFDYAFPTLALNGNFDGATWETTETDLGYSVRRSVPTRGGFPALSEQYEIMKDGVVKRTGIRGRQDITSAERSEPLNSWHEIQIAGVIHGDGVNSRVWRYASGITTFLNYDAPVSVLTEMCVVVEVDIDTLSVVNKNVAILPPGWNATCTTTYRNFITVSLNAGSIGLFLTTQLTTIRTQLLLGIVPLTGITEAQDQIDRINAAAAFIQQLLAAVVIFDGPSLASILVGMRSMFFNYYVEGEADAGFLPLIDALINRVQAIVGTLDLSSILSGPETVSLFKGYMSTHMSFLDNPTGFDATPYLEAGAGTFLYCLTA